MSEIPDRILAYLATPYSKYPQGIEAAFEHACELAGRLLVAGIKVYSPIAHTHPIAIHAGIDPLDHSIWLPFDEAMMRVSRVLIVAHMDGWETSKGIAHEVDFFKRVKKPIYDLDPKTLRMERRKRPPKQIEDWVKPRGKAQHFTSDEIEFIRKGFRAGRHPFDVARDLQCSTRCIHTRYRWFREGRVSP